MRTGDSANSLPWSKAAQAKTIGEHADSAEGHGRAGNRRAEQNPEGWIQNTGRDGDAKEVVAEGPAEVLTHDTECLAGEQHGIENLARFTVKKDGVAGFAG